MSETTLVTFNNYLTHENTQNYLKQVLGKKKEAFVTNCVSLVSNNVNLQNCVPATVMYSAIKATSLGLPLDNNLGFAYVLPYNNAKKGVIEAQFQLGYKGFIQLAMRSGQFQTINATDVRDGEIKKVDRLTGEIDFEWIDKDRDSKSIIGYVAFFRLSNGFTKSHYMTIQELEKHGQKYSKSYATQFSNWKNMFEAMATKTVIKLLLSKYAPLSIEMQEAVKFDQSVIRDENEFQYIDNDKTIDIDAISEEEEFSRIRKFIAEAKTKAELKEIQNQLSEDLLLIFLPEIDEKNESLKK